VADGFCSQERYRNSVAIVVQPTVFAATTGAVPDQLREFLVHDITTVAGAF
jgi:hypothetical protein